MRLYQKALVREMSATAAIALAALTAIVLVSQAVRILGTAATGDLEVGAVLPFITFGYLRLLPILLSLSMFIGALLTLARFWQDNEMAIWSGAGLAPTAWITPILRFAVPITLIIAGLSLVIVPWVSRQKAAYEDYLSTRHEEAASLTPGIFAETSQGQRVYFVESLVDQGPEVRNIFIQSEDQGRTGIVIAERGRVETQANGDRFLVLYQGRRYEGTPGQADYRVMQFARYGFRLDPARLDARPAKPRELDSWRLLTEPSPVNQSELVWRLGYPISALLLALFAIPLSVYNPRVGRSFNILFAALLYALYNNMMGLSQTWVARGDLSAWSSLGLVHGATLGLLVVAFWWRYGHPLRRGRAWS